MAKEINSLGDLLKKKADDIDSSGIKDDVALIQQELDRSFNKEVRVERLQEDGVLIVKTKNSAMASEVRLKQYVVMQNIQPSLKNELVRFRIIIG